MDKVNTDGLRDEVSRLLAETKAHTGRKAGLVAMLCNHWLREQSYADRLAALEAGMRGLEAKWRGRAEYQDTMIQDSVVRDYRAGIADSSRDCADELSALLNRPADGGRT